jgi:hypothetical protein
MQYLEHDLGHLAGGTTVRVDLSGDQANVRLIDATNYARFARGDHHQFYGGLARRSPVALTTPYDAHWHVVVDRGGYAGHVGAHVTVI